MNHNSSIRCSTKLSFICMADKSALHISITAWTSSFIFLILLGLSGGNGAVKRLSTALSFAVESLTEMVDLEHNKKIISTKLPGNNTVYRSVSREISQFESSLHMCGRTSKQICIKRTKGTITKKR